MSRLTRSHRLDVFLEHVHAFVGVADVADFLEFDHVLAGIEFGLGYDAGVERETCLGGEEEATRFGFGGRSERGYDLVAGVIREGDPVGCDRVVLREFCDRGKGWRGVGEHGPDQRIRKDGFLYQSRFGRHERSDHGFAWTFAESLALLPTYLGIGSPRVLGFR